MFKVKIIILENGERYPILIGQDEMPHFYTTLYVTAKLRSYLAVNTIENRLKALLCLFEWENKRNRCLVTEFEQEKFLTPADIADLRDHLKINKSSQKKSDMRETRVSNRVLNVKGARKAVNTIDSVGRNHHYNRMTCVAEYLHFIATITNQYRNSSNTTKAINKMAKDIKKARPKGQGRNAAAAVDDSVLSDGLLVEFMDVAEPTHPLNPFTNETVKNRNYLMFRLIKETGIRRGELLSLELTYLELTGDRPSIWVRRKHDDKFDPRSRQPVSKTKERKLPIKKETAALLDHYILNERAITPNANKHPYLFITHRKCKTQGQPVSVSYFDNEVIPKMKAVDNKFSIIHAHLFRHEWNVEFSEKIDQENHKRSKSLTDDKLSKPPIDSATEAKMRKSLMGHSSEKSGDVYDQRHIRNEANEIVLAEQKELQEKIIKFDNGKDRK